jgi:hypothetical protein
VADTIYTRSLARGVELQGSAQALASLLRVPETTLLRWMSGRAQMPLQAFLKLVELLTEYEKADQALSREAPASRTPPASPTTFQMGALLARCERCDGEEFLAPAPLRYISKLACASCGEEVAHSELIVRLARETVQYLRTLSVARGRRQPAQPRGKPKPAALRDTREREDKT